MNLATTYMLSARYEAALSELQVAAEEPAATEEAAATEPAEEPEKG